MKNLNLAADIIDVRDIIERFEELEKDLEAENLGEVVAENNQELAELTAILEDLKGYGGDEQWRGDWYPVILIARSHFKTYAQELAEDMGAIDRTAKWPMTCIDWEAAADELEMDYTSTTINGTKYLYR